MPVRRTRAALVSTAVTVALAGLAAQPKRPISVDDLMRLRSIVDVQIAPDGQRVAYVVSTPSLARNEHEAALFVVASISDTFFLSEGGAFMADYFKRPGKTVTATLRIHR